MSKHAKMLEVLGCAEADLQGCLQNIQGLVNTPPDVATIRTTLDEIAAIRGEDDTDNRIKVRLSSAEFGNDAFYYDTMPEALAGIERLVADAKAQDDGIERIIGIVVNEEE